MFSSLSSSDRDCQSTRDKLISHMYVGPSSSKRVSLRMRRSPASFTSGQAANMAWRTLISKSFTPKEAFAHRAVRRSSGVEGRSGVGGVIAVCARVPKRDTRPSPRDAAESVSSSMESSSSRRGIVLKPDRVKAGSACEGAFPFSRSAETQTHDVRRSGT